MDCFMSLLDDALGRYQRHIGALEMPAWEISVEQRRRRHASAAFAPIPRKTAQPDASLIDLDLIRGQGSKIMNLPQTSNRPHLTSRSTLRILDLTRSHDLYRSFDLTLSSSYKLLVFEAFGCCKFQGSAFAKSKPQCCFYSVVRRGCFRAIAFPFYRAWWRHHLGVRLYRLLCVAHAAYLAALVVYTWHDSRSTNMPNVSAMELITPAIIGMSLSVVKSQIVAYRDSFASDSGSGSGSGLVDRSSPISTPLSSSPSSSPARSPSRWHPDQNQSDYNSAMNPFIEPASLDEMASGFVNGTKPTADDVILDRETSSYHCDVISLRRRKHAARLVRSTSVGGASVVQDGRMSDSPSEKTVYNVAAAASLAGNARIAKSGRTRRLLDKRRHIAVAAVNGTASKTTIRSPHGSGSSSDGSDEDCAGRSSTLRGFHTAGHSMSGCSTPSRLAAASRLSQQSSATTRPFCAGLSHVGYLPVSDGGVRATSCLDCEVTNYAKTSGSDSDVSCGTEGSMTSVQPDHTVASPWDNPLHTTNADTDLTGCTIWECAEAKKVHLSTLDICAVIVNRVNRQPQTTHYFIFGSVMSVLISLLPAICRLLLCSPSYQPQTHLSAVSLNLFNDSAGAGGGLGFIKSLWIAACNILGWMLHVLQPALGASFKECLVSASCLLACVCVTSLLFFLLSVAERSFKQRLLFAKYFCHLTSARRARKFDLPHFRLKKVRNIKTWLSVRSCLKRTGPQRSVNMVSSVACVSTVVLVLCLCVELLEDADAPRIDSYRVQLLVWCFALGVFLLRIMTLGAHINKKYRNLSVVFTEQINVHLQIERKPHKKDSLVLANNVLKLAADLLKELDRPFTILGFSANPFLYNITKLLVLSACSGVLSDMFGFKLKLYKLKLV